MGENLKKKFSNVLNNVLSYPSNNNNYENKINEINILDNLSTSMKSPRNCKIPRSPSQIDINYLNEYSNKLKRDQINKAKSHIFSLLIPKDECESATSRKFSKMKSNSCTNIFNPKPKMHLLHKEDPKIFKKHFLFKQEIIKILSRKNFEPQKNVRNDVNDYRREIELGFGYLKKHFESKKKFRNLFFEEKYRKNKNFFNETNEIDDLFDKARYKRPETSNTRQIKVKLMNLSGC